VDTRGTAATKPDPGPFHCLACRTYVTGTPSGHCPKCGFVPPQTTVIRERTRVPDHTWSVAVFLVASLVGVYFMLRAFF